MRLMKWMKHVRLLRARDARATAGRGAADRMRTDRSEISRLFENELGGQQTRACCKADVGSSGSRAGPS